MRVSRSLRNVLPPKTLSVDVSQLKPRVRIDKSVNAFVSFDPDRHLSEHEKDGHLGGSSIAVKNNICTAEFDTTCSSRMLQDFQPKYNATVVDLLQKSGGYVVGKTNSDEFGMGSLNLHTIHGPVINPFQHKSDVSEFHLREKRSAGGSSGGSAAAVASMQCYAALSTDTGGSTRLPAAYCGVTGFKPSYGFLSRWGVISFADSLDTVGIISARVSGVRRVFECTSFFDDKDPTSTPDDLRSKIGAICNRLVEDVIPEGTKGKIQGLRGLRVGIPQEYFPAELDPSLVQPCQKVLAHLKSRGATLVPVSLPSTPYALSAYYVLASAEASSNMARYDGIRYGTFIPPPAGVDKSRTANVYAHSRSHGFGREVQKRILLGTYALTADAFDNYFLQAQRVRKLVRDDFDRIFRVPNLLSPIPSQAIADPVDVLIHPSAIRTAPLLSGAATEGLETYVQDALTVPASLAGLPALTVPAGYGEDGWPVGVSVVGQWGCDEMVLSVGKIMEEAHPNVEEEMTSN